MDFKQKVQVGRTPLMVNRMGLGTAALGFMYQEVSDKEALQTIEKAYELGIRFFDTSPLYGTGLAEQRVGKILSRIPREDYTLATKVGYDVPEQPTNISVKVKTRDYSYEGIMRSFENSLKRLDVDKVDIVHIHDADEHYQEAITGAYRALAELRSQGVIKAVGAGMNQSQMLTRFAQEGEFDCFLLAGRYTLLDQTALADLLPVAMEKQISLFIGGPLNSGILADPYSEEPMFNYQPAPSEWIEKARKIDTVCRRYDIPLKAAALQFPLAHPAVASVLTGARSLHELIENVNMMNVPIPGELWTALKEEKLLPEDAYIPQ